MEDLWAFNDERVARAIFRSRIPVISAVGHEPDVTIADFVADLRASTPSNAAELAVPDQADLRDRLAHFQARMDRAVDRRLQVRRDALRRLGSSPFLQSPQRAIQEKRLLLDYQQQRLLHAMDRQIGEHRQQMGRLAASLDALSPFKVLSRGYSITQKDDGTVVSELSQVEKGDTLRVRVSDGTITCTAEGKEKTKWRKRS